MDRIEQSVNLMNQGLNCSQALLTAFGQGFGIEPETALNLARVFGGGMGRLGLTCGAVTGAVMVLGLAGKEDEEEPARRQRSYALARELVRRFETLHGTIACRELLGADLNSEEGMKLIKQRKLLSTLCPALVRDAAILLDEMLPGPGRG